MWRGHELSRRRADSDDQFAGARANDYLGRGERAPPGMPVVATGPGSAEAALWQLRHGAVQLLCVPPAAPAPNHVVIHTLDPRSRQALRVTVKDGEQLLTDQVISDLMGKDVAARFKLITENAGVIGDLDV